MRWFCCEVESDDDEKLVLDSATKEGVVSVPSVVLIVLLPCGAIGEMEEAAV